jgi:hypothetical protein
MAFLSEAQLESALLEQLAVLGYATVSDDIIGPDGKHPERAAYDEVVLAPRLAAAVARLNPALPPEARNDAIRRLTQSELPNLLEENRRLHRLLTEGADVEYYADDGVLTASKVKLIDFDHPTRNDWLAVQQFTVVAGNFKRRPDVVVFVNGLPLAVVELKAPGGENATLDGAFNQLQTYKQQIPALFRCNALLVTSDGLTAHDRWPRDFAQGHARAGDAGRRRIRAGPSARSAAALHGVRRRRRRANQDRRRISPVPRGEKSRGVHLARDAARGDRKPRRLWPAKRGQPAAGRS